MNPRQWSLAKQSTSLKVENGGPKVPKKKKTSWSQRDGVINQQNYNFNLFCFNGLS